MDERPRRPLRRYLLGGLLCAASVLLTLWVRERLAWRYDVGSLRYPGQVMAWRTHAVEPLWRLPDGRFDLDGMLFHHHAHLDLDLGSHRLRTNRFGWRGPEVAEEKPPGTWRLLVLGDSVAYGGGRGRGHLPAASRGGVEQRDPGTPL